MFFKYEHFFFLKTGNLIINWVTAWPSPWLPSLLYKHTVPEKLSSLTKYELNGTSKIPVSQLFSELGKIWKCNTGLYSKNSFFHLLHGLGKIWEVQLEQHSNIPNSLCQMGKPWKYSLRPTLKKSLFRIYGWIGKIFILI